MSDVLVQLARVLEERKSAPAGSSYVQGLYAQGANAILGKVGEEAVELVLAAKDGDRGAIIHETADLWFHTMVLLCAHGLGPGDVLEELERRAGVSGLVEKAGRVSKE